MKLTLSLATILVALGLLVACDDASTQRGQTVTITVAVTGKPGSTAHVKVTPGGDQGTVKLPWSKVLTVDAGKEAKLSASNTDGRTLSCVLQGRTQDTAVDSTGLGYCQGKLKAVLTPRR